MQTHWAVLIAQRTWIYVQEQAKPKFHPKLILLVTHNTGPDSCGTLQKYYFSICVHKHILKSSNRQFQFLFLFPKSNLFEFLDSLQEFI